MTIKLPFHRLFLSHCIVVVFFFQLGLFVKYERTSFCDCEGTLASDRANGGPTPLWDELTTRTNNRTLSSDNLPPPFANVSHDATGTLRSFLMGESVEDHSKDEKETVLVRLSARREHDIQNAQSSSSSSSMAMSSLDTSMPLEALQGCSSIKVLHQEWSENTCLVVAPFQESYHVYRWEQDLTTNGRDYRPVHRIRGLPDSVHYSSSLHSFDWAKLFLSIQNQVSKDLQQLLLANDNVQSTQHPIVLLLVANKENVQEISNILLSSCLENEDGALILVWCLDPETQQFAQQLSLTSYYHADWQRATSSSNSNFGWLFSELLAVQQLVLLGNTVVVHRIVPEKQHLPLSQWMMHDWRKSKPDVSFLSSPNSVSLLQAPIYLVKSNVRTKALWSKLVLSMDLLLEEGIEGLDDIISEYASLFGMNVKSRALEKSIVFRACS